MPGLGIEPRTAACRADVLTTTLPLLLIPDQLYQCSQVTISSIAKKILKLFWVVEWKLWVAIWILLKIQPFKLSVLYVVFALATKMLVYCNSWSIITQEPSDLIIISRTEGSMCGINIRYMGDYGMAGLKWPKLCVWPVLTTKVTKKWCLFIISRTDNAA